MRISDWSSDVCSSDLDDAGIAGLAALGYPALACSHPSARIGHPQDAWDNGTVSAVNAAAEAARLRSGMTVQAEDGRASCRERVCKYGSVPVGAVASKITTHHIYNTTLQPNS